MSNEEAKKTLYLVTRGNGFIASALVKRLVGSGANVRDTVRRAESGTALRDSIATEGKGRLEVVIVEDITAEGGFGEALRSE